MSDEKENKQKEDFSLFLCLSSKKKPSLFDWHIAHSAFKLVKAQNSVKIYFSRVWTPGAVLYHQNLFVRWYSNVLYLSILYSA